MRELSLASQYVLRVDLPQVARSVIINEETSERLNIREALEHAIHKAGVPYKQRSKGDSRGR
jgi:hypothetical protein